MVTVRIYAMSDDATPVAIPGVAMRIYNEVGSSLVTSAITNASGVAEVTLPESTIYQVRACKVGVAIESPKRLQVVTADPTELVYTMHVINLPEAMDPTMCRVSGVMLDVVGAPLKDVPIRFSTGEQYFVNSEGDSIASSELLTAHDGTFVVDLYRGVTYDIMIGMSGETFSTTVPDRPGISFSDLVFYTPVELTFPAGLTLAQGETYDIPCTVILSNYSLLQDYTPYTPIDAAVQLELTTDVVEIITSTPTTITVKAGNTSGSAVLSGTVSSDNTVWTKHIPEREVVGSLTINVT